MAFLCSLLNGDIGYSMLALFSWACLARLAGNLSFLSSNAWQWCITLFSSSELVQEEKRDSLWTCSPFDSLLTFLIKSRMSLCSVYMGYYFLIWKLNKHILQFILQKTSTIVRAEVDIYERIASKGLNDPLLNQVSEWHCFPNFLCTFFTTLLLIHFIIVSTNNNDRWQHKVQVRTTRILTQSNSRLYFQEQE